jgi:hypothetical protein
VKHLILLPLFLAGCAIPAAPDPQLTTDGRSEASPAFDASEVQRDLEASARAKFGAALTEQALASPAFLLAKHYFGLSPPPIVQPDGSYRYPDPPTALLIRRDGTWLAARPGTGFSPVAADKAAAIEASLRDPAFWSEPEFAMPTCTDAGSSLLWLKLPARRVAIRRGACGATQRTERMIFLALDS